MFASSAGGEVIFVIAMLIYGAYSAWSENKKKKEAAQLEARIRENEARAARESGGNAAPAAQPAPAQPGSEQERLRKFLEALGVPGGQAPAPPPPPPPPRPVAPPILAPRPVAQPVFTAPRPASLPARPVPRPVPVPVYREEEMVSRESSEPGTFAESLAAIDDTTSKFNRISSGMDVASARTPASAVAEVVKARPHTQAGVGIREAIRTPETLRTAFLLREVLGPPPGL